MHQEWTDRLSDYLDGELTAAERAEVDAHLRGCEECRAVAADLRRVVENARVVAETPRRPDADLWSGIAARIQPAASNVAPFVRRGPRRVALTLPQLAAAAALVAAVSGGLVWKATVVPHPPVATDARADAAAPPAGAADRDRDGGGTADAVPNGADRAVQVGLADAQYDAAVEDLERALKQGRGRLDASTIATVEHNLQTIDQAIQQARDALEADPANTYLSGHLVETRRRKLDLLRRAAALTTESN